MKKLNALRIFIMVLGTMFSLINTGCKKQTEDPIVPETLGKLEMFL